MLLQPLLSRGLAVFAHRSDPAGGLVHKAQPGHWPRWCNIVSRNTSKTRPNLRSHKDSSEEGSIWQKITRIFPWFLGHGTHSERISDGKAAWNEVFKKSFRRSCIYYTKVNPSSWTWRRGSHKKHSAFLYSPQACWCDEPRRASPQLISPWGLHTACPMASIQAREARCQDLLVGWT